MIGVGREILENTEGCPYCESGEKSVGYNVNNSERVYYTNKVAKQFKVVEKVIWALGVLIVIIAIIFSAQLGITNIMPVTIIGIIILVITWFITLIFQAIAEVVQLLNDIKDKLK